MQDLLNNWWQLRTSTDIANRETAIKMESWLDGCEEYAMEQVGRICELVNRDWREFLKKLDLHNYNLTSIPAEIGNLKSLNYLDLRDNNLTSLPTEIAKLQALKWLRLNRNNLTSIPAEIAKLQALKWLFLQDNPITKTEQQRIRKLLPNCIIYF